MPGSVASIMDLGRQAHDASERSPDRAAGQSENSRASADDVPISPLARRTMLNEPRLCRAAEVAVVESADRRQRTDAAALWYFDCARLGSVFRKGELRARALVVAEIAAESPKEMSLVQ